MAEPAPRIVAHPPRGVPQPAVWLAQPPTAEERIPAAPPLDWLVTPDLSRLPERPAVATPHWRRRILDRRAPLVVVAATLTAAGIVALILSASGPHHNRTTAEVRVPPSPPSLPSTPPTTLIGATSTVPTARPVSSAALTAWASQAEARLTALANDVDSINQGSPELLSGDWAAVSHEGAHLQQDLAGARELPAPPNPDVAAEFDTLLAQLAAADAELLRAAVGRDEPTLAAALETLAPVRGELTQLAGMLGGG
ncbi:MAG: hypothetical protein ACYC1D_05240 [Acidimicrobiales bacterium]